MRSGPNGVMLEIDGKLEALGCSGLPEKLVFAKLPEGLRDTPTLSARIVSPQVGHYSVKLSYIATGLDWSADYIARIHPDGRTLDLSGWITLANFSETGFANAPVEVVAGNVATTGEDGRSEIRQGERAMLADEYQLGQSAGDVSRAAGTNSRVG